MKDKNAVVTGVAGFIGSNLAEKLLEEGYVVKGIDSFDPYYSQDLKRENVKKIERKSLMEEGDFELVEGSINKIRDLKKLPKTPDKVFHLAARPGTRSSIGKLSEYRKVNVEGTSKVINYFEPVQKMVYMSSSSVYGEKKAEDLPVREQDSKNPRNPYARTKLEAEKLVEQKEFSRSDSVILRPFTVFGPRQRPDEAFTSFISNIIGGKSIKVYGDGSQSRDFTFVDNVIEGTLLASRHGSGVYNLGKGKRNTVNDIIDIIEDILDQKVEIDYGKRRKGDVTHTHADISKSRREIGFDPSIDLREPVEKTIKWVEEMKKANLL